jgi:tetratricopeptide (TPR) repeat protein
MPYQGNRGEPYHHSLNTMRASVMDLISPRLLAVAKDIVRSAAELGLDEAGTRICGSLWPSVKKIMQPVISELDRRYPTLMMARTQEATEAAVQAIAALDRDASLKELLDEGFKGIEQGQTDIRALLSRYDDKLHSIGTSIDRGFEHIEQSSDAILDEIRQLSVQLEKFPESRGIAAGLTLDGLFEEANACLEDAIHQFAAENTPAGESRLRRGRELAEAGLHKAPDDRRLLAVLGYLEKTQAQIEPNPDRAAAELSKAAECFAAALRSDPNDLSALNGMANVYSVAEDYDRAIKLGETLFKRAPGYGAAIFDYALALEGKLKGASGDRRLLQKLATVYRHLEGLMGQPEQRFPATHMAYVAQRVEEVRRLLPARKPA